MRYNLQLSELRNKVYRQLNKGEHRHGLARWIFFANQGKFQVGDYEEIMNKASCLSLVSNAALYWNTVKMSEIVQELRNNGEDISDTTLSHISLLPFKHIGLFSREPRKCSVFSFLGTKSHFFIISSTAFFITSATLNLCAVLLNSYFPVKFTF